MSESHQQEGDDDERCPVTGLPERDIETTGIDGVEIEPHDKECDENEDRRHDPSRAGATYGR